jgi:cation:H+ antiporter
VIYLLAFAASGAIVVLAGVALARHADAIAEATKIGRLWVGSVLLAGATSLPELATSVAAVRLGAVDLAVGDLFGSSLANMLILALVDLLSPRRRVLQQAAYDHALGASLAILLNALAAACVLAASDVAPLGVSPESLLLFLVYLAGTRALYRHGVRQAEPAGALREPGTRPPTLRRAALGFAAAAAAVLVAAPAFAWSAQGLATVTGLGDTFVGTWLVGLSTSLPELVASLAAVRMGAFDLAIGNLFGSNAFNMAIFFMLDLAQPGSLFAALDPAHALAGLFAVALTSLGLAAVFYRAERRFPMIEPDSALILVGYLVALGVTYARAARP